MNAIESTGVAVLGLNSNCVELVLRSVGNQQVSEATVIRFRVLSARRCKREDDGVEGTYGYELECYLNDLPATVCCPDQLPARVEKRAQSFVVE
jgi:hypothetical protein